MEKACYLLSDSRLLLQPFPSPWAKDQQVKVTVTEFSGPVNWRYTVVPGTVQTGVSPARKSETVVVPLWVRVPLVEVR
jgi:hypothetical protein